MFFSPLTPFIWGQCPTAGSLQETPLPPPSPHVLLAKITIWLPTGRPRGEVIPGWPGNPRWVGQTWQRVASSLPENRAQTRQQETSFLTVPIKTAINYHKASVWRPPQMVKAQNRTAPAALPISPDWPGSHSPESRLVLLSIFIMIILIFLTKPAACSTLSRSPTLQVKSTFRQPRPKRVSVQQHAWPMPLAH